MNKTWNLDPIYKGFSDPAFASDMQALEETIGKFDAFVKTLPEKADRLSGLQEGISLQETLSSLVEKLATYANLCQAANTKDPEPGSQMGRILALYSKIAAPQAAFETWASGMENLMELVQQNEKLRDYTFLFENMKEGSQHLLPGLGEEIMAKMSISGGSAWSDLHGYITSTVPVIYRGEKTNLSGISIINPFEFFT